MVREGCDWLYAWRGTAWYSVRLLDGRFSDGEEIFSRLVRALRGALDRGKGRREDPGVSR